jgi:uncharacterized SAM-binding protein YcdF (DUF218 family)
MLLFAPVRWAFKLVTLVVVGLLVYFAATFVQVWLTARRYEPRTAGAIVVMGAAQYDGVPSPDLAARLDEGLLLFREGYSHLIGVTGSKEKGDSYTESETGARYLEGQGVPAADIVEAGGDDSWRNLSDIAPLLKARGVETLLVVSDPFHEDRSMAIASSLGFTPFPTPTHTSPIQGLSTVPYFVKETLGVGLGRIIGFQRLHALG